MTNPLCDKYFTKTKEVAKEVGLNPIVKYRVFTRFDGIAALTPMARLIMNLTEKASVTALPEGTPFKAGETIAVIEGELQELVELETTYLQWAALPCYCASEAKKIVDIAKDKIVMDFSARHLYSPMSSILASYGAKVGGIKACSTDAGMNWEAGVDGMIETISADVAFDGELVVQGTGTTPHALLAIFKGDYSAMADAYIKRYPDDYFVALVDYNNREISDSLLLLEKLGKNLRGVRIDTCGENHAQVGFDQDGSPRFADSPGVCPAAVRSLRNALDANGGEHVKIFLSSGFNAEKTDVFMKECPRAFDGIGTGSFIPKGPTATADIYMMDGRPETKVGREWGVKDAEAFLQREELQIYSH